MFEAVKWLKNDFTKLKFYIKFTSIKFIILARNYGYAKYATIESAMKAIELLHGQNIGGNRLKVIEAEPTRKDFDDEPYKKQRT